MRRRNGLLSITAVLLVLGFLAVLQFKVQSQSPGLAALTAQELTSLIGNLSTRNQQLEDEVAALERQAAALAAGEDRGQTSLGQIRADLERVRAFTGLIAVEGPGVRVVVDGPVPADGLVTLLNELRNAGAEAIAVDGVRLVPGVAPSGPAGALRIGSHALAESFEIGVIGLPETLTGSLTRIGGPIAQLAARYPEAFIEVNPVDAIRLPATERDLRLVHARPRI